MSMLAFLILAPHLALAGWGNSWQRMSSDRSGRSSHSAVWCAAADGMYVFAGSGDDDPRNRNDLQFYSAGDDLWETVLPGGSLPVERYGHSAVWNDEDDEMYVFAGMGGTTHTYFLNDLHVYSRQSNRWQQLYPQGIDQPSKRYGHSAVWSVAADAMFVFGGWAGNEYPDELYRYSRSNRWELMVPAGTPPTGRDGHSAVWCGKMDGMYIFGGYDGTPGTRLVNDLHFYSRVHNAWEKVSPSGAVPPLRSDHTAVWSEETDGMYVFGGFDTAFKSLDDFYFYSRSNNAWQQLSPSGTLPSGRRGHSAVWSVHGMWVFGGYSGANMKDLWLYQIYRTGNSTTATSTTDSVTTFTITTGTSITGTSTTATSTSESITSSSTISHSTTTSSLSTSSSTTSTDDVHPWQGIYHQTLASIADSGSHHLKVDGNLILMLVISLLSREIQ